MTDKIIDLIHTDLIVEEQENGSKIYKIKPNNNIHKDELLSLLTQIYDIENKENYNDVIYLNLKGLSVDLLSDAIKYSLTREDLKNPLMILNIINLIKIYNTLDDSFFENEDIYVSSIEELLDLKLSIGNELKQFIKQLSIYFVSLFKSYNKTSYSPLDNHIKLPSVYDRIFLSSDLLTLSGILSVSPTFSTDECVYIEESLLYISNIMRKNIMATGMINLFLEGLNNGNSTK